MRKKILVLFCIALCLSMVLAACSKSSAPDSSNTAAGTGGSSVSADQGGDTNVPGKKIAITFFASMPPWIKDLKTNAMSKLVEDKFNLDITWNVTPELQDKKPLILASGDYPEVFFDAALTKAEQLQYGQQGVFIPLNDLIDKYAPNIKKAFEETSDLQESITAPDGNIYAIPQVGQCFHCYYSQKYWINTLWLKNLGLEMPTTTEEFHQVLKAFKDKDPNKNGKKDEIPLTGTTKNQGWHGQLPGFLMNAFIYDNSENYFIMKDGKLDIAANKPEWRKGLEYMHLLYSEGLIDKEAFTQKQDARDAKTNSKPDAIVGVVADGAYNDFTVSKEGETRYKEYDAVPPLIGPDGVQLTGYYGGVDVSAFAITNKATEEQQIAVIKLVDYLYTEEGTLNAEFGVDQKFWRPAKPGEKDYNGNQAKYAYDNASLISAGASQNDAWSNFGPTYRTFAFFEQDVAPDDIYRVDASQIRLFKETKNKYAGHEPKELPPLSVFVLPDEAAEANQLKVQINDYIESSMTQFITGQKDLNKDWDAYVKGLENLNLQRYLEIYQNAIQKK